MGSNPCPQQSETYTGFEIAAVLRRRTGVRPLCRDFKTSVGLVVTGMGLNPIRSHFFWQPKADLDRDLMSSIFFYEIMLELHN